MRGNVTLTLLLALHTVAFAQGNVGKDTPDEAFDRKLGEVSVFAGRRLKDVGIEKMTLDTLVLHDNVSLSMGDILSQHSSLFVKSYGRATEATAEFRGTSPSHTQVMWNGLKINSPMLGTFDFSTIPAYFIDEANLYHGASSLSVTSGGLGGAVELLTRQHNTGGTHLQYVQGIGSYGTYDEFMRIDYKHDRWSLTTRAVYSSSDNEYSYTNYDKMVDEKDGRGNIVRSYHPTERNKSGYFTDIHVMQQVAYNVNDRNRLALDVWYTYLKRGLPFLSVDYKDASDFRNEHEDNTLRAVLSWNNYSDNSTLAAKAGWQHSNTDYQYYTTRQDKRTDITSSESHAGTAFATADYDISFTPYFMLTASASAYFNKVKSSDKSPFHVGENFDTQRLDIEGMLQARWRPLSVLAISAGVRQSCYGSATTSPVPVAFIDYIVYKPWNVVLKASVTRNYRYPSMDDLYFQPGGNSSLKPESGFTYDGGIEMKKKADKWSLQGNVSVFNSYISDWIMWTPNTRGFWQPSNVKKVHNYGVEATADASLSLGKNTKAAVTVNYAWTPSLNQGERMNSNDESYGKQLCYVPETSANINIRLTHRSWQLQYQWIHYSERFTTTSNEVTYITGKLEPYYMSNLSLEKSLRLWRVDTSVKAVANNLFSTEYVTVLSHPMPRRNYELFIKLNF